MRVIQVTFVFLLLVGYSCSQSTTKKPLSAYSDADFEKLYDQWEDNDEEKLPEDELPPWKRQNQGVKVDLNKMNLNSPDDYLKATKRGQMVMLFAKIADVKSEREADGVAQIWQDGLFNAHIDAKRYMLSDYKVLFSINDGAQAWKVKEFLVKQKNCESVTIDGKEFPGVAFKPKTVKKVEL